MFKNVENKTFTNVSGNREHNDIGYVLCITNSRWKDHGIAHIWPVIEHCREFLEHLLTMHTEESVVLNDRNKNGQRCGNKNAKNAFYFKIKT